MGTPARVAAGEDDGPSAFIDELPAYRGGDKYRFVGWSASQLAPSDPSQEIALARETTRPGL
jgi:hypothetical protein